MPTPIGRGPAFMPPPRRVAAAACREVLRGPSPGAAPRPPRALRAAPRRRHPGERRRAATAAATRSARSTPTGVVELDRAGLTLGDFFAVWRMPLSQHRLLTFRGEVTAFVGGQALDGRRRWDPAHRPRPDRPRGRRLHPPTQLLSLPAAMIASMFVVTEAPAPLAGMAYPRAGDGLAGAARPRLRSRRPAASGATTIPRHCVAHDVVLEDLYGGASSARPGGGAAQDLGGGAARRRARRAAARASSSTASAERDGRARSSRARCGCSAVRPTRRLPRSGSTGRSGPSRRGRSRSCAPSRSYAEPRAPRLDRTRAPARRHAVRIRRRRPGERRVAREERLPSVSRPAGCGFERARQPP